MLGLGKEPLAGELPAGISPRNYGYVLRETGSGSLMDTVGALTTKIPGPHPTLERPARGTDGPMVGTASPATSIATVPFAAFLDGVCEDRLGWPKHHSTDNDYPLTRNYYENNSLRIIFRNFVLSKCPGKKDIFKELRVRFVIFRK